MSGNLMGIEDYEDFEASLVIDADFADSDFSNQAYKGAAAKQRAWSNAAEQQEQPGEPTEEPVDKANTATERPAAPGETSPRFEPFYGDEAKADVQRGGAAAEGESPTSPESPESLEAPGIQQERQSVVDEGSGIQAEDDEPDDKRSWYGKRLGNYRLRRVIGSGNFGIVFQAEDVNLQRITALKVLRKRIAGATEKERVQLFLQEARAVAALDHPNIVQIYEINDVQGWWYIAMEYLEGGNLLNVIKNTGAMDPHRASILIADAAGGLAEAHEMGIVHRDIKPDNLMLTRRGICKVADFGLVKNDDPNDPFQVNKVRVGTPLYMAPEVALKKGATTASDIYSLAATMYVLLCKRPPFVGKSRNEIMRNHIHAPIPDIREQAPHVSENIANLLTSGMAKEPEERPTAAAFAMTLRSEIAMTNMTSNSQVSMSVDTSSSGSYVSPAQSVSMAESQNSERVPEKKKSSALTATLLTGFVVILLAAGGAGFYIYKNPDQNPFAAQAPVVTPEPANQGGDSAVTDNAEQTPDDLLRLQSQAIAAQRRIAAYDNSHGFKQMKLVVEESLTLAETAYTNKRWTLAQEQYQKFLNDVKAIDEQQAKRTEAIEAQKKMEIMKLVAIEQKDAEAAGLIVGDALRSASSEDVQAKRHFAAGDFEMATASWRSAEANYEQASTQADLFHRYLASRQSFEDAYKKLPAKDMEQFGGEQWQSYQSSVKAVEEAGQTDAAIRNYEALTQQTADLVVLVNARKMEHINSLILDAGEFDNEREGKKGIALLDKALALDPQNSSALKMKDKLESYFVPGRVITNKIDMRLVYIPDGKFMMGSPGGEHLRDQIERRFTAVISDGFYMSATEITWAQWKTVMKDYTSDDGDDPKASISKMLADDQPVTHVRYDEAVLFCKKLSEMTGRTYRLPTEAEWEYAARAGTNTAFHTGNTITFREAHIAGYQAYLEGDDTRPASELPQKPVAVATYSPNAWGLYDMHGNVKEWCYDWYADYPLGEQVNPKGPDKAQGEDAKRVIRGGDFLSDTQNVRSAKRIAEFPQKRDKATGFRVVLENN